MASRNAILEGILVPNILGEGRVADVGALACGPCVGSIIDGEAEHDGREPDEDREP